MNAIDQYIDQRIKEQTADKYVCKKCGAYWVEHDEDGQCQNGINLEGK